MSITRKTASYAAATIIGAAALTATLASSAWASSWDYGYGSGSSPMQAHTSAILDLETSYAGCTNLTLVSDTRQGNGWYAVEAGYCSYPK
jgi:hypothetical protein